MNPSKGSSLPPPTPTPWTPSTQASTSTSVALLTETSLSWKHLTDTSIIYRTTFFTIAFKGTKHKLTPHTYTQTHLSPHQPSAVFLRQ